MVEQAQFGEAHGYQSFWLPEFHFNTVALPDPLMVLAAVAAGTRTLQLATTSYLLPLRNPLLAAEQVAVLDHLSAGRVLLGVGRGYSSETLRSFAIDPSEKRARFQWALQLMIRAWSGAAVSLHDDGACAVTVEPRPVQRPHPPIWIAAFGPKALRQAGAFGMPYLASPLETLHALRDNFEHYDKAVAAAGHAPVTTRPIMRTLFVSEHSTTVRDLRARLTQAALPAGLTASPQIEDWAIIGDRAYVVDKLAQYRELLKPTHLVVTRLRIEGLDENTLRASLGRVADIVHAA